MKSILFATTALVATAGVASAEIALTGMAEMGIFQPGVQTKADGEVIDGEAQFFTDIDVTFTMSGEADNGLTFGASIDLDESNTGAFETGSQQGGETIFISYGGATFTMGDTDGALDARVPELALAGGSLNDDETVHLGFNHSDGFDLDSDGVGLSLDGLGDGQIARFDYAYDAFTFSLSAEQVDDGADADVTGNTIWGLGVSYAGQVSTVDLNVGLGYQTLEDYADITTVAVTGGFGSGFSAGLTYTNADLASDSFGDTDSVEHWGIGLGYEMNALALGLNYGEYDIDGGDSLSGWGFAALYDLGGGLEARFGYGYSEFDLGGIDDDYDTYSLGLRMNF
ncbi:porin [Salipiger bermudensis]|uniref:porin n=1 Tax=Salipiger bermudensis TaxID=344736 RepID=UPI001C9A257D|nr:porin [Salipiger bermudensis]MBY6003361.1 porin [Salipiger bermudensis]